MMKTMQEIADALGLARSTVSLCLSGRHQNYRISAATVKKVRDYAEQAGFVPNRMAGHLGKTSVAPVGLIIREDSSFEKSAVALRYAMNRLQNAHRDFVIQGFVGDRLADTLRMLKGLQIKELIMFGIFGESDYAAETEKIAALLQDENFYSVDYSFPAPAAALPGIYRMGIDRLAERTKLMKKLQKAGKGNFMCDGPAETMQTLFEKKLLFDKRQLLARKMDAEDEFAIGRSYAKQVLKVMRELAVRTVLVSDDRIAVGLTEGLAAQGVRVPEDVQVIGFDNLVDAPYFRVPLTTIEVPVLDNTRRVLDHILDGAALPAETLNRANVIWRSSASC